MAPLPYNLETLNMIQSKVIQVKIRTMGYRVWRYFTLPFFNNEINRSMYEQDLKKRKEKYKSSE